MNALTMAVTSALVQFVWQGTAVGIFLWIILGLMKGQSPRARYTACCAALLAVILLPLFTGIAAYQTPLRAANSPRRLPAQGNFEWLLPLWACGVFVLSVRLVWGARQIMLLRRRCSDAPDGLRELATRVAARMGLNRVVRVFVASLPEGPCVIGWIRPAVVVPFAALTGLMPEQLEAILAHEMAHIRRYDPLVNVFQLFVETLLFYHPAVWWISWRMRTERELCCDDLAVASCGDAIGYARALTELEKMRVLTPALGVGSTGGSMYRRIERIVGAGSHEHGPSRISLAIAVAIAVSCSVLLIERVRAQAPDHLAAGDALLREGKSDAAIQEYESGMRGDPAHKVMYLKHETEAYIRQGKMLEARADAGEILKIDLTDAAARGLLATFALDAGDVTGALKELQNVVAAMPDNFVARYNLYRAYTKAGDRKSAMAELETALELRPDYEPAKRAMAAEVQTQHDLLDNFFADELKTLVAERNRMEALRLSAANTVDRKQLDDQVKQLSEKMEQLRLKIQEVSDDRVRDPGIPPHVLK